MNEAPTVPEYTYPLDFYRGQKFHITVRLDPDANNVQDFAVTLHYTDDAGEEVEIVRIDTAHSQTHMDRLFRSPPNKLPMDLEWHEAEDQLRQDWRKYARRYDNTHGL